MSGRLRLFRRKKMDHISGYSTVNTDGAEAQISSHQVSGNYYKDPHRDVRDSLKKLGSWREESQREFDNVIESIDKAVNDLIEEVCGLKAQLVVAKKERNDLVEEVCGLKAEVLVTKKERNDLVQIVGSLNGEIRKLNSKLAITPLPNNVDTHTLDPLSIKEEGLKMEISDTNQQDVEKSKNNAVDEHLDNDSKNTNQLNVAAFNDLNNVDKNLKTDIVDQQEQKETETESVIKREVISLTPSSSKSVNRTKHINGVHENIRKHVCGECGYGVSKKSALKRHIDEVHNNIRNHFCGECGYAAKTKGNLNTHIKTVHEKIKNHVCGECGFAASEKSKLKRHIEAVHKNIKNHICGDCGHAASKKDNLMRHIKAVHENVRNHICGECGYAAKEKSKLITHVKEVHKNIREHACGECGYAAFRKSHLQKHMETVHENIKNHACVECGFTASHKGNLNAHIEAVHILPRKGAN